ncbi:hypothetical protein NBRC116588_29320 [Pyruvatibacter sp. HU-CL02332]|jgi:type II secretory pathway pseudopilin PulG
MMQGLFVLVAVFVVGFAAGFAVRAILSHRRRARIRRERSYGMPQAQE